MLLSHPCLAHKKLLYYKLWSSLQLLNPLLTTSLRACLVSELSLRFHLSLSEFSPSSLLCFNIFDFCSPLISFHCRSLSNEFGIPVVLMFLPRKPAMGLSVPPGCIQLLTQDTISCIWSRSCVSDPHLLSRLFRLPTPVSTGAWLELL